MISNQEMVRWTSEWFVVDMGVEVVIAWYGGRREFKYWINV